MGLGLGLGLGLGFGFGFGFGFGATLALYEASISLPLVTPNGKMPISGRSRSFLRIA